MENRLEYLEQRIQYLEEINRFTFDALEMAASLGDFQASINKLQEPSIILEEAKTRLHRLIPFDAEAFFLVDELNNDFYLAGCWPEEIGPFIQQEMDYMIDNGTFAWSIRQNRPVIFSTKHHEKKILLHVMATNSRVRGMFMGLLDKDNSYVSEISLSLLSIILLSSANALESFELYKMLREINETLEKKENYRLLFEAAPDGVEVLDPRGNIVECNKTHERLLGYRREAIIGNHTTAFFSEHDRNSYKEKFRSLQETGYAEGEIEMIRKDHSKIQIWRKERAIYGDDGDFVGSVIYNRDISDLKRAEKDKQKLRTQLRQAEKMEAIGMLAGGVAHDLNNVLAGLVSYPELLLMEVPADSPLRKMITTIHKSGQKAAAIVQDLLTLARRGVTVKELMNLNIIIEDYLQSPEFEGLKRFHPNIEFDIILDPDLFNNSGSSVHISKVLMNLVSNAAEAMTEGGRVSIRTENYYLDTPLRGYEVITEGEYVVLHVFDSGIGMSRTELEKIFEPFYTKKVMGRSGTGLGMTVVWNTVKDHGGFIDIQSDEGSGTRFTLYFPATREIMPKQKNGFTPEKYKGQGESILVVDDVEEQRDIAANILTRLGYSVSTVPSGEEAVRFLNNKKADLLVLDMIMNPGIDGLDTYKRILKQHPRQKAIIASGFSETRRVKEAQRLGAGEYLKKPYSLEKIGIAVHKELHRNGNGEINQEDVPIPSGSDVVGMNSAIP